jgi:hypothetical protein
MPIIIVKSGERLHQMEILNTTIRRLSNGNEEMGTVPGTQAHGR